jgi:N-carbamoyl-L-amino-acid hydrolase
MAFSNEEGVVYAPDMMGSLVAAGGMILEDALDVRGVDGTRLGDALAAIGYDGPHAPGHMRPHAFVEIHIEQGPLLEVEGIALGAVADLQGISWQRVRIEGQANHAGTTPTAMRRDAGLAAARVVTGLRDLAKQSNGTTVATVGTMVLEPNAINVIPSMATFTVDLRDPDEERLRAAETALERLLADVASAEGVSVSTERLARFAPVTFDAAIVASIERVAAARGISCRRMTSGAGHDAQMMARVCPAAMIFVPSRAGISHNPAEHTDDGPLRDGAQVLLDVVTEMIRTG